jgi:sugar lactone lactonase YvrE
MLRGKNDQGSYPVRPGRRGGGPVRRPLALAALGLVAAFAFAAPTTATAAGGSFIGGFASVNTLASTVPTNGDVNPYGLVVVPRSTGALSKGDALVSNFNAQSNLQGTGTTIVEIAPNGGVRQFAQIARSDVRGRCPGGVGLTTALAVLRSGFVVVGSLPTSDGSAATAKAGCLIVLDHNGRVVETISGRPINGPWDMTALDRGDHADLFVTNVLNGTVAGGGAVVNRGTVVRIGLDISDRGIPEPTSETVVGSGFAERSDPAALVVGPTGVGLARDGTLYVVDTVGNRIGAIPDAVDRDRTAFAGEDVSANGALNAPLGLTLAPNGDILTANGGDGNIVETTPQGSQVATKTVDPAGAGVLFGLAIPATRNGVLFVDDGDNTLKLLQ